jgi:hypothetical protein
MSVNNGKIRNEDAFAQGKMHDSSGWYGILPRKIMPSDIDLVFDNNGRCVFLEMTKNTSCWGQWKAMNCGQYRLFSTLIRQGEGKHVYVLWFHNTPVEQCVDTRMGCLSFSVMFWGGGTLREIEFFLGDGWPRFVDDWFASPESVVAKLESLYSNLHTHLASA